MAGPAAGPSSPYVAIVHRDRSVLFVTLATCRADPGVDVVWDRRIGERRGHVEGVPRDRRAGERRGSPPPSWRWPGFVIVETPDMAAPPRSARKRVLLVEDDSRVREVLYQALAMAGYDVVATCNGEEALAACAAAPADLVITDLLMPRKDGWRRSGGSGASIRPPR